MRVCLLSELIMYDIDRLSIAFQTDRPELVNRCCWSSWGWGHGASPQSWSKTSCLTQLQVSPVTWFMPPCYWTLWLPPNTKLKVDMFLQCSVAEGQNIAFQTHDNIRQGNIPKKNRTTLKNGISQNTTTFHTACEQHITTLKKRTEFPQTQWVSHSTATCHRVFWDW